MLTKLKVNSKYSYHVILHSTNHNHSFIDTSLIFSPSVKEKLLETITVAEKDPVTNISDSAKELRKELLPIIGQNA